ncbi:uncharacterized protein LOC135812760 [Sycon ciliatum]|uniref:uncharacterized protein LOC135812760 n=1 Tax=Sycon ciliatum TaxID=27933 RepID=UPI0031F68533
MADPVGTVQDPIGYNDASVLKRPIIGGLLMPIPAGVSSPAEHSFIVRGNNDQLFSKPSKAPPTATGGFNIHECTVIKSCGYEPSPPQRRVAFQTPRQPQFMGTNLSLNKSIWSYDVQEITLSTPEKALFRPETHFVKVGTSDKGVFELHSGMRAGVLLAVSHRSSDQGYELVMMPSVNAKAEGLTTTFSWETVSGE